MEGIYEVFYSGNGYLSSTRVKADSKEAALSEVQRTYKNCVEATHAITIREAVEV